MSSVSIDSARLWERLMALAEVGAYTDERTGLRGVNRLALTDADAQGRRLVKRWFQEAGLEVRVDRIGNVIGRREGSEPGLAPVMSGSHIDSVPTGGAFDGCLGVLGALEVVRSLNDAGLTTRHPLEIGFFTDEEGARFGTDMLGSGVLVGRLSLEEALAKADTDGVTVGDELRRHGFDGDAPALLDRPPAAFVEVHVEQGPVLAAEGVQLGVVTGVQAIAWREIVIGGKSAHAGTTPMALRRDAGLAAARIATFAHELAVSGRYGEHMRATIGRLELGPNRVNIVPNRAVMTVDLRNPDDAAMSAAELALEGFLETLRQELGVSIDCRVTAKTGAVVFDADVQDVIAQHAQHRGLSHQRILSGAGHDAQEFAAVCPTAMVFVPGLYDGISHNPREYSTNDACAAGVQVLADTLLELAC